jgi:DNA-3-methyladenine glycosylase II
MSGNTSFLEASRYLSALDADWARLVAAVGPCTHAAKPEREPYEALVRAVAHQQLHRRAAEAILQRLESLTDGFPEPARLLALDDFTLRSCGFSLRKIATLRAIAEAALSGLVPARALAENMDDEVLIKQLVSLPGIGRWTVEMLLIYTLERGDILPVDDYGVRAGYRWLKSLPELPTPKALREAGQAFSPYRTVAAWYLWRALELPDYRKAP